MRWLQTSWLLLFAVGCGGGASSTVDGFPDSSGSVDEMKFWAPSASAASLYYQSITPLFIAGFNGQNSTCPAVAMSGTTETYTGGCTDTMGRQWVGSATATAVSTQGGNQGPGHLEYDGFGFTQAVNGCTGTSTTTWNGTLDESADSTGANITFSLDLSLDQSGLDPNHNCASITDTVAIAYQGSIAVSGPSNMQVQTFDGSGEVGTQSHGKVSASTDTEVIDSNTCSNEAMSGTTTITASGHTAVITYDGATSCDQTGTVTWTYDGVDQGELAGVGCNAGGGAADGMASALLVLGAVLLARRRQI